MSADFSMNNRRWAHGAIDHPTQNPPELPLGGTDTDKQNSSAQLACVCLSLGHLAAKL